MKTRVFLLASALVTPLLFDSCATTLQGKTDPVQFATVPAGGSVTIDGTTNKTPATVEVAKKTTSATFSLPGKGSKTVSWTRKYQKDMVLLNVIILPAGGTPGIAADTATGAIWQQPESVTYNFQTGKADVKLKPDRKTSQAPGTEHKKGRP